MNDKLLFLKKANEITGSKPGSHMEAIRKQAQFWTMIAKISPIIFLIVMCILWHFNLISYQNILWVGGIMFGVTAITWWFWTVHTIGTLAKMVRQADSGVKDALGDLKEIRNILRDIRRDQ